MGKCVMVELLSDKRSKYGALTGYDQLGIYLTAHIDYEEVGLMCDNTSGFIPHVRINLISIMDDMEFEMTDE